MINPLVKTLPVRGPDTSQMAATVRFDLKFSFFSPLQMVQQVPLFLGLIQFSYNLVLTPL